MKYGIYYAYWEKEWAADYVPYVKKVAKLGFDVLEVGGAALPDMSEEKIKELHKVAIDNNVEITVGYGPTAEHNMGSKDPSVRKMAEEWYKKLFEVMGKLDAHTVGGALYTYWPVDFSKEINKEEDWKYSVEGMRVMADLAKPYNINLCMESLNRFEGYLINCAEEDVRFVKEVGKDNVKAMLDTFHMNIEEDNIGDAIRLAEGCLGHFHTGECNRKVPGQGRMSWEEISKALKDIKYDGYIVMEPFVRRGGQVEKDIHIWRNLKDNITEEMLDREAKAGVEFERKIFG